MPLDRYLQLLLSPVLENGSDLGPVSDIVLSAFRQDPHDKSKRDDLSKFCLAVLERAEELGALKNHMLGYSSWASKRTRFDDKSIEYLVECCAALGDLKLIFRSLACAEGNLGKEVYVEFGRLIPFREWPSQVETMKQRLEKLAPFCKMYEAVRGLEKGFQDHIAK